MLSSARPDARCARAPHDRDGDESRAHGHADRRGGAVTLPDAWPPAGAEEVEGSIVPVFPLPNVWLYPLVVLPLHIFEERYRQMLEDSLDGPGRMALATIQNGHEKEAAGDPPIYPIAGYGEIGRHERLDDGSYNIWLVGLKRMRIEEVESDRLYRKVAIHPALEIEVPREREPDLRTAVSQAIAARVENLDPAHEQLPLSRLVDFLTLRMPLSHAVMNLLYSELDIEKRARLALEEHGKQPQLGGKG